MENPPQNSSNQSIVYCGNLSPKVTTSDLQSLFSKVATVIRINIKRRADGASAFAFVYFPTTEDAENVVKEFNFYDLHGKQMNLMLFGADRNLPEDANIFVKNLPPNLNSKDLYEIFKMFGTIISCKVASNENGELKGYGYVQYKNPKAAKKAIASCKNVKIGNYLLEVQLYDSKIKNSKNVSDANVVNFTNCYVKNFPQHMNEEGLRKLLEEHGHISSLYFPVDNDGVSLGFAFANFETLEGAANAIKNLHNHHLFSPKDFGKEEGLVAEPFYIQKAENKKEREESLKKQVEKLSLEGKKFKRNLYVSNIPDSFTNEEIKSIFLKFGNLTDFKISKCVKSNKQYGYVCYSTPEEACVAFKKLDGTSLDENRLYISYYKNKFERTNENQNNSNAPYNPDLGFLSNPEEESFDNKRNQGNNKKIMQIVYNLSEEFKGDWKSLGVSNSDQFVQKIMKNISELPTPTLQEMSEDSQKVNDLIDRLVQKNKEIRNSVIF